MGVGRGPLGREREDRKVAKKGHTEEQILRALHQAESGAKVADICREHGVSEATYYVWKKKYSDLGLSERHELRQTHLSALHWRWPGGTDQGAQEDCSANSGASSSSGAAESEVEYGLRRRETTRWPLVPRVNRGRPVHSGRGIWKSLFL
jgi:transposase-like protein